MANTFLAESLIPVRKVAHCSSCSGDIVMLDAAASSTTVRAVTLVGRGRDCVLMLVSRI
jgi:hypothetical protein